MQINTIKPVLEINPIKVKIMNIHSDKVLFDKVNSPKTSLYKVDDTKGIFTNTDITWSDSEYTWSDTVAVWGGYDIRNALFPKIKDVIYPSISGRINVDRHTVFEYVSSFDASAYQGICSDGTYIYVTDSTTLYKYTKAGVTVTSRDISGDDATYTHNGDICYYDGYIYVARSDYPTSPSHGSILKILASDLSKDSIIATNNNHCAGTVCRKSDGTFWITGYDDLSNITIKKYSSGWVYQDAYSLGTLDGIIGFDGIEWIGGYLFANIHEGLADGEFCDKFSFNETTFTKVQRIHHTINTKVCSQGISLDPTENNVLWWAARGDSNKVYKTNVVAV